jgi:broad specificity phosphatase PhoE
VHSLPQVILLRHGQTDHNKDGIMQGLLDVPLNRQGEQQADLVAKWLGNRYQFDQIYSSNLQRAKQTAVAIADRQDCPLSPEPALREIDVGKWQGLTYRAAQEQDPELWQQLLQDPMHVKRPGGESFVDVYQRVTAWWQRTVEPLTDEVCCIVTHGVPVRAILAYALDVDPADFGLRLSLANTGVSTLEYDQKLGRWRVQTINSTCHLGE